MKVYLNKEAMRHKEAIIEMINEEITWNCNFNGITYEIASDDFIWVDKVDEQLGSLIVGKIFNLIEGSTYEE
jgi:hypothetical protein